MRAQRTPRGTFRTLIGLIALASCSPASDGPAPVVVAGESITPLEIFRGAGQVTIGVPRAVTVDFNGVAFIADASPARIVSFDASEREAQEFQQPGGGAGFYPTDVAVRGFFVYAVNETDRTLLRWDNSGTYRDVLVNFQDLISGRRVSPHGLAVDASGRVAVTDVENHQVLLLNTYLQLDVAFGNYGTYPGQLDAPLGVSFAPSGELVVADTGNRRIQFFSDGGAFKRVVPSPGEDNPMRRPRRAVVDAKGQLFIADPEAGRVFVFSPGGAMVRALIPEAAKAFEPTDVAMVRQGRIFVTDAATGSLLVFKVE